MDSYHQLDSEFQFFKMERVLEMDGVGDCLTL